MNKILFALFAVILFIVPSQAQAPDMVLEEDGEAIIIVNWEEFLEDFPDNPIIEPIIFPEEENEENDDINIEFDISEEVSWENELGEENEFGEEELTTEGTPIEPVEEVELIIWVE